MSAALPQVPARREAGHVYRSEYAWQERRGATYHELHDRMWEAFPLSRVRPGKDGQVTAREALAIVRRYLPRIRTTRDLYAAAAWQPFKVILRPCRRWVLYTNWGVLLWAKARAAGRLAPWEAA